MPDLLHLEAQRALLPSIEHTEHTRTLTSKRLRSQGSILDLQAPSRITKRVQGRIHSQNQTPGFLGSPYNNSYPRDTPVVFPSSQARP